MGVEQLAYETLHTTYKKTFEDVSTYAVAHYLSGEKYEEAMFNLYDVLFQAQTDGMPVEKLIGNDIQQFCQQYFGDTTILEKVLTIFVRLVFSVVSIFGVEWFFFSSQTPFNLGKALTVGVIWLIWERLILDISNAFFKQKDTTIAIGLFSLVGVLAIYTIVDIPQFAFFIPREITMWGLLVLELIIFAIYKVAPSNRQKARQYVKRLLKEQRSLKLYKDMLEHTRNKMEKKYQKKVRKQVGLEWRTFLETENKRLIRDHTYLKYVLIGYVILSFFISTFLWRDGIRDGLIFMVINAVIAYPFYKFSKKGEKLSQKCFNTLLVEEGERYERI